MPDPGSIRWLRRATLAFALLAWAGGAAAQRAAAAPAARASLYDPSLDLGALFPAVQLGDVFPDSKTFVDARPLAAPARIEARYLAAKSSAGFDLRAFVTRWFEALRSPGDAGAGVHSDTSQTMEAHIRALWPTLTRTPDTVPGVSSLIPLPRPYVVPGGRFREIYYWDSYFTMLGLVRSGRLDLVRDMLENFASLVRTRGHIPNGNRSYYLSRSQPPFFAAMVGLYAAAADTTRALRYLDALEAEHAYWMAGAVGLAPGHAFRRVVRLGNVAGLPATARGAVLNRYWDDRSDPRPEAFKEDYKEAQTLPAAQRAAFYRNMRAGAESGWDYSSRWMRDAADLRTMETTSLVPVDLNSVLYEQERTIAALLRFRHRAGDAAAATRYDSAAAARRAALLAIAWDSASGFFYDVRWAKAERVTDRPSLAAVYPLYFALATPPQAHAIAERLRREFLKPGGFVTTLIASGQQWDAPNGWPPLQWLAIEGLRRFGEATLADTAAARWLALNRRVYRESGKMIEKYNVVDPERRSGGGEYPTQDGFGWTNGVALALAEPQGPGPSAPGQARDEGAKPTSIRIGGGGQHQAGIGGDRHSSNGQHQAGIGDDRQHIQQTTSGRDPGLQTAQFTLRR